MHSRIDKQSPSTRKVFYWNGIVDPRGLSELYEDIVSKLINGDYASLDLEKLRGHTVYSVRVNQSNRLLFTTIMVNDEPYLMLLDEVLNHDYAKSRFLKPAVLKHYLELRGNAISEELVSAHFESCAKLPASPSAQPTKEIEYSRIDFYNQKFIELDAGQLNAVTKTSLPLIISGAPGSGKSCIALLILGHYVETHGIKKNESILYVTESENLACSMKLAWSALPVAQGLDEKAVQIISYQELLKQLAPKTAGMKFVDKEDCKTWLIDRIKQCRDPQSKASFADVDSVYQELRIISACVDLTAYLALGQKQSLYHKEAEKRWLFSAYGSYQSMLESKGLIHAPFYSLGLQNLFKLVVVDEAQDFSHLQLETLSILATKRQICFCEDNRQSLSDNKSKIPFLKRMMNSWGATDNHITLQASYRCPAAVIRMANAVSGLKSLATGEGQPEVVTPLEQSIEGSVTWHESLTETQLAALQQAAQSPDFAIITLKKYKEEVKKRFQTMLVFTAEECKGLEYKYILAWCPLDAPLFKEANKSIGEKSQQGFKTNTNRAKKDQGQEQYGPGFSVLYTIFTRATTSLVVFQKRQHGLENICNVLSKTVSGEQVCLPNNSEMSAAEFEVRWYQQAKIQIAQGNIEIAQDIYLNTLHRTQAEFEAFRVLFAEQGSVIASSVHTAAPSKAITVNRALPDKSARNHISKPVVKTNNIEIYDFLNSFIKVVSKNKSNSNDLLNKLLTRSNARALLFDYPMEDGACLFTRLFYEESSRLAFISCMSKHRKLLMWIGEDAFCRYRTSEAGPFENTSPLYWFSLIPDGLKELLSRNPKLIHAVSAEALCRARTTASGKEFANTSALYFLSEMEIGRDILKMLITGNHRLAKAISAEMLCLACTNGAAINANTSPFYFLAATETGPKILEMLFVRNRKLAQTITADALCLRIPAGVGPHSNSSPLYWLSLRADGRKVLKMLLVNNPELSQSISIEDLLARHHAGNTSPLEGLRSAPDGQKIIKLLSVNKNLARLFQDNSGVSLPSQGGMFANSAEKPSEELSSDDSLQFDSEPFISNRCNIL